MKTRLFAIALATALMFTVSSCANDASAADAGKDDSAFYELDVQKVSVKAGESAELVVTVKTKPGYKWNAEFPSKLTPGETELVTFGQKSVKGQPVGDDAKKATAATFRVPLTGKAAGVGELEAKMNLSVCTDKTCHVFRRRAVKAEVTVQ